MRLSFVFLIMLFCSPAKSQEVTTLVQYGKISLRGLSVLDNEHAWVSGSNGTVGKTNDGGNTWKWIQIPGYEKSDFRDIELLDTNIALIMAIDTPAVILRTEDGGKNWKKVYENKTPGIFMDAMDFFQEKGYVVGDAIGGYLFGASSDNEGTTWNTVSQTVLANDPTEGFFASSGTNVGWYHDFNTPPTPVFVSGGKVSNIIWKNTSYPLPIIKGEPSTGANSLSINPYPSKIAAVIVGGDFTKPKDRNINCVLIPEQFFQTPDTSLFVLPNELPHGYKSCVTYIKPDFLIATGTSGTDISTDGGVNWKLISTNPFHVVQKAKHGELILFAGSDGTIAKYKD